MIRFYAIANLAKGDRHGLFPVYILVKSRGWRFTVATGLTTPGALVNGRFPRGTVNGEAKEAALVRYLAGVEEIVLRREAQGMTRTDLKALIRREVFGEGGGGPGVKVLADWLVEYGRGMKASTATLYRLTADRVREYDGRVTLDEVTRAWLEGFEGWLRTERGLSVNGIGQKMRNIRTVMNWCRDEGVTANYPFRGREGYRIREEEVEPKALTAAEFRRLRDYPVEEWQRVYRDLFCLSVYLGGVNAGDLLLSRGLTRGRFVYVRRKTDKVNAHVVRPISVPVCPEAMEIIERYGGGECLLNVLEGWKSHSDFVKHWNGALKKIGPWHLEADRTGRLRKVVREPLWPGLTTYWARYTFASVAVNDLDFSEEEVGKVLGHAWATGRRQVTSRYVSKDLRRVDRVVLAVAEYLRGGDGEGAVS